MLWMTKRRYKKSMMKEKNRLTDDVLITFMYGCIIPSLLSILYLRDVIALHTLKVLLVISFIVFIIGPLIFKYSYRLQQSVVFLNFVNLPKNPNYSNPSAYGIEGLRNFYIESEEDIRLGVWQILPANLLHNKTNSDEYFDKVLNDGQHIIIYNHGNSGNRAASHRIELYKVLRKQFHVIAFDYRSYGDSSNVSPTETGIVRDCVAVYNWVANRTSSKIFIWGHSLGTGLSTHMLSVLGKRNIKTSGLILESPFTSMREEISEHPLGKIFRPLPWFHYTVVEPMQYNNFTFANDKHILNVDCPILIFHAEDDRVVPYKLGYKLYLSSLEYRKPSQGSIEFIGFASKFGYGHKYICRAPELSNIIENFIAKAILEMEEKVLL